ncbi:MAG: hypothetical protein K2H02_03430, partial [Anaeroplasmataceae bacterium]|nr:hypothetical protein [Anaeroplasmataceae bacterium]
MKKIKKLCLSIVVLSLLVLLVGCKSEKDGPDGVKEPDFSFNIQENIVLESNENINWANYIEIIVDGESINLTNDMITLISGDNTKDGNCTYEISYQNHKETFTVTFDYPDVKEPVIVINVTESIKLTSDEDIKWADYVAILADNQPVKVTKDMITLISGDSSVSGTCQYEVSYQGQKKTFTVTFDYTVAPTPVITITVADN